MSFYNSRIRPVTPVWLFSRAPSQTSGLATIDQQDTKLSPALSPVDIFISRRPIAVPAATQLTIESLLFPEERLTGSKRLHQQHLKPHRPKPYSSRPPFTVARAGQVDSGNTLAVSCSETCSTTSASNRSLKTVSSQGNLAQVLLNSSNTRRLAFGGVQEPRPRKCRRTAPCMVTAFSLLIIAVFVGGIMYMKWKETAGRYHPLQRQGWVPLLANTTLFVQEDEYVIRLNKENSSEVERNETSNSLGI